MVRLTDGDLDAGFPHALLEQHSLQVLLAARLCGRQGIHNPVDVLL